MPWPNSASAHEHELYSIGWTLSVALSLQGQAARVETQHCQHPRLQRPDHPWAMLQPTGESSQPFSISRKAHGHVEDVLD